MEKSIFMFEELEIEMQGLSNMVLALWNAMQYSPCDDRDYLESVNFLAMLLCKHRDKMSEAVKMAFEEGKGEI